MKLAVIACLHGNEPFGVKVIDKLKGLGLSDVGFFIANKRALSEGKRFIDVDLNRCFPGNPSSKFYEERLASELLRKLKGYKYVIDLHSSSSSTPPIIIITKRTKRVIDLAISTGVKRICFMSDELASGKSLIDHVTCGVSIEAGNHHDKSLVDKTVKFIINALINNGLLSGEVKDFNPEFYEVVGLERDMSLELKDFKKHDDYYPILVDEASYDGIKCLKAKRINP